MRKKIKGQIPIIPFRSPVVCMHREWGSLGLEILYSPPPATNVLEASRHISMHSWHKNLVIPFCVLFVSPLDLWIADVQIVSMVLRESKCNRANILFLRSDVQVTHLFTMPDCRNYIPLLVGIPQDCFKASLYLFTQEHRCKHQNPLYLPNSKPRQS